MKVCNYTTCKPVWETCQKQYCYTVCKPVYFGAGQVFAAHRPLGEILKQRGVAWTYYRDAPSLRLLDDQPEHGCDLCSRYRRRAVYEVAHGLGANVIAFGRTGRRFMRGAAAHMMFTGS